MNTTILGRLAWKEYRLLRDFWVAMAALCGLCLLVMGYRMKLSDDPVALFYVAMGVTAFYALGCGTMALAGEREARTDDFQRALPVSPRTLLWGKLRFALASTLALGVLMWLLGLVAALEGWREVRTVASLVASGAELALLGGITALQLLAWSLFFSMRSSHPLRVVILTFLANAIVSYPIMWLLSDIPDGYRTALYFPSFFGELPTVLPRLVVVAVVFWLDFRLVQRWCRDTAGGGAAASGTTIAALTKQTGWWSRWNAFPQWQRLTWQEWRSGRWMIALTALTYVVLAMLMDALKTRSDFQPPLLVGPLLVVGGLLGTFAFHSDQRRRHYRFLAEHGVSPRRLWWTRQACWFAVLLCFCLVVAAIDYFRWRAAFSGWVYRPPRWRVSYAQCDGGFIALAIICYSVGQLLSLWVPSAAVRWTTAVLYGIPVVFWATLMASLRVPLVWSVAPIPVMLLVASRASVRDWIVERTGRSVRLKKTLILAIPAMAIIPGVIAYRFTEIPNIEPQFAVRHMTPAELTAAKAKGEEYLRAMDSFDPWLADIPADADRQDLVQRDDVAPAEFMVAWVTEEQKQWLDQHRTLIERTSQVPPGEYVRPRGAEYWKNLIATGKAPAMPEGFDMDEWAHYLFFRKVTDMTDVLLKSALVSQKDGDLDGALDRYVAALRLVSGLRGADKQRSAYLVCDHYPHIFHGLRNWAGQPGQTPTRIRRALQAVDQTGVIMPDLERQFEQDYSDLRQRLVSGDVETDWVSWHHRDPSYGKWLRWFYRLLPWEHRRVMRLLNTSTAYSVAAVTETRRAIEQHEPVNVPSRQDPDMQRVQRWSDTTQIPDPGYVPWWWDYYPSQLVELTVVQRTTLIVLALEGWRLEHGSFPKSLDELSPSWLTEVPVDPWTGKQFTYCPDGEDESVKWFDEGLQMSFILPPHSPFIEAVPPIPDYYKTHPEKEPPRYIFPIPVGT